jgi:hypothetical protein
VREDDSDRKSSRGVREDESDRKSSRGREYITESVTSRQHENLSLDKVGWTWIAPEKLSWIKSPR